MQESDTMNTLTITKHETKTHKLAGIRITPSLWAAMQRRMKALKCDLSAYVRALVERDIAD